MNILQKFSGRKRSANKNRPRCFFPALLRIFFGACLFSLLAGSTRLNLLAAIHSAIQGNIGDSALRILLHVRLPRTLASALSGSALAVSGVLLQAALGNPLAAPNLIGVNAGAGFAAVLLLTAFPASGSAVPLAAFSGALGASLLIFALAAKTGARRSTILLAGVAVSSILTAGINALKTLFPDQLFNANTFLIGGFSGITLQDLSSAWILIAAGLLAAVLFARESDLLTLGDETAAGLGLNVPLTRFLLLTAASCLAGAAVSFSGLIGFVGLLVPHIARRFTGGRHRLLIPASALLGAALVLICDTLSRVLFAPYELPVGIFLSLLGGPFFLFLLLHKKSSREA